MSKLIIPSRRKLLLSAGAILITSPAIISKVAAQMSGGAMFPGPGVKAYSAAASVAFDAVSTSTVNNSGITTLTWTHTPVGTPTCVGVGIHNYDSTSIVSVTYGGVSMTNAVTSASSGVSKASIWGLANPPSGAQSVVVTFSGTGAYCIASAITVTGSNTGTAFNSSNSATGTGTTPSVNVTSATGELVFDVVGGNNGGSFTQGGSQTIRWGPLSPANVAAGSTAPAGSGSTTMSWTLGLSNGWAQAAASFKA